MLLFRDRFVGPILRREKTVTRRGKPDWKLKQFRVGSVHRAYVTPPWAKGAPFASLRIVGVTLSTMQLDAAEARLEGFADVDDFLAYAVEHDVSFTDSVARIEFELVQFDSKVASVFIDRHANRATLFDRWSQKP